MWLYSHITSLGRNGSSSCVNTGNMMKHGLLVIMNHYREPTISSKLPVLQHSFSFCVKPVAMLFPSSPISASKFRGKSSCGHSSHDFLLPRSPGNVLVLRLVCICVCFTTVENESIYLAIYKTKTCLFFQRITHHSVWDEMKSLSGVRMKSPPLTPTTDLESCVFFLVLSLCFSPLMYFLSQNVSREKRKLKEVMKTMGLRDTAFWLSWGLLYAVFVLLVSCMLGLLLKNLIFEMSSFSALFLLFFCYGISSICFCFMISALLKKPKTTCFAVFVLIFSFGALSLLTLINLLPAALEWILSLCCPFAFGAAISKVDCHCFCSENEFIEISLWPVLALPKLYHVFLIFLLDKYGVPYPATFFLKKSYWRRSGSSYTWDAPTNEQNHGNIFSDNAEPVPPEFDGKEAIRMRGTAASGSLVPFRANRVSCILGLSLNIYEGQITAVLGHSGAGKTTLLNILSGLSQPSDGSTTICTYNISKREDMKQIREMLGVCPQFNIQFEFLTVKENLKTFAKIKGIPSKDVDKEVQNILTLLDIGAIQDTQANRLSGGQKRKLSLGITFLGDPQVLLLDEPTAGLDPYSRHLVWALLNERKAGRVTLFTTQFMDEADILADRKAFISRGRLTCVGSSLFLKKKWGIGYHLRLHVNELCDSERITSLVQLYIPAAKLSGQRENELSYTLPLENLNKFPDLFSDMDGQTDLGIVNYGVTMTTLEDVFLRLEGDETIGTEGEVWLQTMCVAAVLPAVPGKSAQWQSPCFVCRSSFLTSPDRNICKTFKRYYFGSLSSSLSYSLSFFGIIFLSGASIDNFIRAVKSQNILLEVISGSNVSDQLVHNGAIKVALEDQKYRFTLMCHMEITHCFPVLVNIISNAFLHMFNSAEISTEDIWFYFSHVYVSTSVILFPAFLPHFAMRTIQDYKIKARSQLRVSGLFPSAYLCGQALVDVPLTCFLLVLLLWPWYARFSYSDAKLNFTMVFCSLTHLASCISIPAFPFLFLPLCAVSQHHYSKRSFVLGEVLGLLGPNGAGKSTTVNMIIGETDLTAGEMLIKGVSAVETEEDTAEFLGHCPQENALWPNLTVKEHLEIYAAVKGIRKEAAAITINRMADNLDLQEHLKKPTKTLSAGLSRKLCFAMSLLGSPTVLLLDESTTGMDPRGKRQVWKTIRTILKDKDQGAILTTHHMEDAEAVCDRVAIMVAGQLRCLGSIQYLKSKFGKNYLLQIKVKGLEQGELLNTRILQMFPQAARQERISTLLVYKVPMEDALPLSKAFSMLEEGRSALSVWTEHVKRLYMCNGPVTALIPD
uniref:ABC transporter domain-containing protein n=1 Tax=Varanus komodoensis TaxID=61221 RepID=A0A8D2J6Y0_VARKO